MLNIILKIIVFILFINSAIAYQTGNVVLLNGKVLDSNGKPAQSTITFIPQSGKQVSSKVNTVDGTYQAILTPGNTYTVSFKDYFVNPENSIFTTPSTKEYTELQANFSVTKIEVGMKLAGLNGFKKNDFVFDVQHEKTIKYIKEILFNNPKISLNILISSNDSYYKTTSKSVVEIVKGKKKTKKVKISSEEQLSELLDKRINSIKTYFDLLNIPLKRLSFTKDIKSASKEVTSKSKNSKLTVKEPDDVTIKIEKIANL